MDKKLQDKLYKKYPKLFGQKDLPITQTCMTWGIDTGDGWFDLLDKLCTKIVKVAPSIEATQVKEKYGTLRFYFSGAADDKAWDKVEKAVDAAERESGKTCEECGKPGKNSADGGYWYSTRCDKCRKKENK